MDGLEHFSTGWAIVRRDPGAWILLMVAWFATLMVCGVGVLLSGNLVRATARAVESGGPPAVGDLFDTSELVDDVVLLVITVVAVMVGQIVPIVGLVVVSALVGWAPMLLADGHYGPIDATIVSIRAVLADPARPLLFTVACLGLLVVASMLCFAPMVLALPVVLVASWTAYEIERPRILEIGDASGARRR